MEQQNLRGKFFRKVEGLYGFPNTLEFTESDIAPLVKCGEDLVQINGAVDVFKMVLADYYAPVEKTGDCYLASMHQMNNAELLFVLGLIDKNTFLKSRTESEKIANERAQKSYDSKVARGAESILFTNEEMESFHPSVKELFSIMLEQDTIIPLGRDYVDYVNGVREASKLMYTFIRIPQQQEKSKLQPNAPVENWYDEDPDKQQVVLLKNMFRAAANVEQQFLHTEYGKVVDMMYTLTLDYMVQKLKPIQEINENRMDVAVPERVQTMKRVFDMFTKKRRSMDKRSRDDMIRMANQGLYEALKFSPIPKTQSSVINTLRARWFRDCFGTYWNKGVRKVSTQPNNVLSELNNQSKDHQIGE